jgi:hypothetical protein
MWMIPAIRAAMFERAPMVTRTASQISPIAGLKLSGSVVWFHTGRNPATDRRGAGRQSRHQHLGCTTLMPRVLGLEEAGCDASQEQLMSSPQSARLGRRRSVPDPRTTVDHDEQCSYHLQLEGNGFAPLDDGKPFCGQAVS